MSNKNTNIKNPVFLDMKKAGIVKINPKERFVQIPWNKNYYVSDYGRLYSEKRNKILEPQLYGNSKNKDNLYFTCRIKDANNTYKNYRIHKLVAEIFVFNSDPENNTEIHHIDGNKENNAASNLQWISVIKHRNISSGKNIFLYDLEKGTFKKFQSIQNFYRALKPLNKNTIHRTIYYDEPHFQYFNGLCGYVVDDVEYKGLPLHIGFENKCQDNQLVIN